MAKGAICSVAGCRNEVYSRGWCASHYNRNRRHGSPTGGRTPPGEALEWLERTISAASDQCILWPFATNDKGYGMVLFEGKVQGAHRASCALVHGPSPSAAHEAAHSCGNGHIGCINPRHLRWATHAENMRDGRRPKKPMKLTAAQAREIAARPPSQFSIHIAEEFGVSISTISRIRRGEARLSAIAGSAGTS